MFVSRIDSAYRLGSGDHLQLLTKITNRGEDAYNAMLWVQLPQGLTYIKAELKEDIGEGGFYIYDLPKSVCSPPTVGQLSVLTDHWKVRSNNSIVCEVGNPLEANRAITTRIYLMPSSEGLKTPGTEFSFKISVKSANPELHHDYHDNYEDFIVPIRVETGVRVIGKSDDNFLAEFDYNLPDLLRQQDVLIKPGLSVWDGVAEDHQVHQVICYPPYSTTINILNWSRWLLDSPLHYFKYGHFKQG